VHNAKSEVLSKSVAEILCFNNAFL